MGGQQIVYFAETLQQNGLNGGNRLRYLSDYTSELGLFTYSDENPLVEVFAKDVIIDGGEYFFYNREIPDIIYFNISGNDFTAIEGDTFIDWIRRFDTFENIEINDYFQGTNCGNLFTNIAINDKENPGVFQTVCFPGTIGGYEGIYPNETVYEEYELIMQEQRKGIRRLARRSNSFRTPY